MPKILILTKSKEELERDIDTSCEWQKSLTGNKPTDLSLSSALRNERHNTLDAVYAQAKEIDPDELLSKYFAGRIKDCYRADGSNRCVLCDGVKFSDYIKQNASDYTQK